MKIIISTSKTVYLKVILFTFFIFHFSLLTVAQKEETSFKKKKDGFIIHHDGTKEYGQIRFKNFDPYNPLSRPLFAFQLGSELKFIGKNDNKIDYKAKELKGFASFEDKAHSDTTYYKSIIWDGTGKGTILFMKEAYKGKNVNLYFYETLDGHLSFGGMGFNVDKAYAFINFGDSHIGYSISKKKDFYKKLPKILKDCPSVVEKLKTKTYKYRELSEVIKDYDNCIDN